MLQLHIKL